MNSINPSNPDLIEMTNEGMIKNGSRKWFCRRTQVFYISNPSGYVRREYFRSGIKSRSQINKRLVTKLKDDDGSYYNVSKPIMINNEADRIKRIDEISKKYKGYNGWL